jgi:hypothetical protein
MRIRKMDPETGDMMFGSSALDMWRDQPEGVAQHVMSRLNLWYGQWFANLTEGTPWQTEVLGERTRWTRDIMLRSRVEDTPRVTAITQYASHTDPNLREWQAAMIIDTDYGAVALRTARLPGTVPDLPPRRLPGQEADLLGVVGSGPTQLFMRPADLTQGPRANVDNFVIRRVNAGEY